MSKGVDYYQQSYPPSPDKGEYIEYQGSIKSKEDDLPRQIIDWVIDITPGGAWMVLGFVVVGVAVVFRKRIGRVVAWFLEAGATASHNMANKLK